MGWPASCKEIFPSPQPEFFTDSKGYWHLRATRYLVLDASDLEELWEYLYTEPGCYYPHGPDDNVAIVRRCRIMPRGKIGGTAALSSYDRATVEVFYSTQGTQWINGMLLREVLKPHTMYVWPPAGLFWGDSTAVTDQEQNNKIPAPGYLYQLTVERSLTYPIAPTNIAGAVNAGVKQCYQFPEYRFPPESVQYGLPVLSAESSYTSTTRYTFSFWHEINLAAGSQGFGWNMFWHAANGQWERLYRDANANNVYLPYRILW